jgi:hypothetical protein
MRPETVEWIERRRLFVAEDRRPALLRLYRLQEFVDGRWVDHHEAEVTVTENRRKALNLPCKKGWRWCQITEFRCP